MNKEDIKELASFVVSELSRKFGIPVPTAGGAEPGAMEVLTDALTDGRWTADGGVGTNIVKLAVSVGEHAEAVEKTADSIRYAGDKIFEGLNNIAKVLVDTLPK